MSLGKARELLAVATAQWEHACSDWWEPADPASCVTNVFYAYENLVVALAEAKDFSWSKNHYKKADLAQELHRKGLLKRDLRDEILRLNDLRKRVSYGEPQSELVEEDLETLVSELEEMLNDVESKITAIEEADEDE